MPEESKDKIKVQGYIRSIRWRSEDTGYTVAVFSSDSNVPMLGQKFTIVGSCAEIAESEFVEICGVVEQSKYGLQFKFEYMKPIIPQTREGVLALLQSHFLPITKVVAKRLVDAFGERVFEVLEEEPDRFLEVKGILPEPKGRQTKNNILPMIIDAFGNRKIIMDVADYCAGIGLSPAWASRIFDHFGNNAIKIMKKNPYDLTAVNGIGFKIADRAALGSGIAVDDMRRLQAGVRYVVDEEAVLAGNSGIGFEDAVKKASECLGVDEELCRAAAGALVESKSVISDVSAGSDCMFSKPYYKREQEIADRLLKLMKTKPLFEAKRVDSILSRAEDSAGTITLDPHQKDALANTLKHKVSIITGGPGVGKTTIIKVLMCACTDLHVSVVLLAPTGRAAKRMSEATGHDASTIHRKLHARMQASPDGKVRFGFEFNASHQLDPAFYIIDETSMLDILTLRALLVAIPNSAHVVFVGDVDQLPSVGAGNVLADMINSDRISVSRLSTIFRQAQSSLIVRNAHAVNKGMDMDYNYNNDLNKNFFFIPADSPESCASKILATVKRLPPRLGYKMDDVQVLAPMKRGPAGVDALNSALQRLLNPRAMAYWGYKNIKEYGGCCGEEADACAKYPVAPVCISNKFQLFFEDDKVMQMKNDYEKGVFNGDVGIIREIDPSEGKFYVEFDGREHLVEYSYQKNRLVPNLSLAYACTVHKSQGNEFPVVVMPILTSHFIMLKRKLLYTGITRGKSVVVLVGQRKAVQIATRSIDDSRRITKLCDFLQGENNLFSEEQA